MSEALPAGKGPPKKRASHPSAAPGPARTFTLRTRTASSIAPERVRWLWGARIPMGALTILSGIPGSGKSRISWDIAARVSRGAEWPDGDGQYKAANGRVLLLAAEDGLADTVRPGLDAAGADCDRIEIVDGVHAGPGELQPVNLAEHVGYLRDYLNAPRQGLKFALVVIDPLSAYMGDGDGKESEVRAVLQPLADLAKSAGVAIVGIMHHAKGDRSHPIHRLLGSQAYGALARAVWMTERHPRHQAEGVKVMVSAKMNIAKPAPSLSYRIGESGQVVWEPEIEAVSAEEVFPPEGDGRKNRSSPAKLECRQIVEAILLEHDGEMASADLRELAYSRGVSRGTYNRVVCSKGPFVSEKRGEGYVTRLRENGDGSEKGENH